MSESDIIEKLLEKHKKNQKELLNFLDNDENIDLNFHNLKIFFEDTKIRDHQHEFRLFWRMLMKIVNNHHHGPNFLSKIEQIILYFKDDIKKYSNIEKFNLFKSNKRILLFLIEEKILIVDEYFIRQIIKDKYLLYNYHLYFAPEIKPFINETWFPKYQPKNPLFENEWVEVLKLELPDYFYELRRKGENENLLCELIRKDSVKDFYEFVISNNISFNGIIDPSIYETNSFLVKNQIQPYIIKFGSGKTNKCVTLIEYAAFFGSVQIFSLLKNNEAYLTPSLWSYAIHSGNPELIHRLGDIHETYQKLFYESIKCHHNDIAQYFFNKYLQNKDEYSNETISRILKYLNFSFLEKKYINESAFGQLFHYDYY